MAWLASLRNRIFVASAVLAVVPIVAAFQFVSSRVTREAEQDLRRSLGESARRLEQQHRAQIETLREMARLVADLPKLKAAVATGDPPTIEPLARDYMTRVRSELLVVRDMHQRVLVALGPSSSVSEAFQSGSDDQTAAFVVAGGRLLEVVSVPVTIGPEPVERAGTLSLGFSLDDARAGELRALVGSEVVFLHAGRVCGSTLPGALANELAALPQGETLTALGGDYVALRRPLLDGPTSPEAVTLRSRAESLRFLLTLRTALAVAALAAVAIAVLLSYGVARTVTGPLAAISEAMKTIIATGDLTQKIPTGRGWEDEDARLLARTFNLLTDSVARSQRDAALRERLSALGRLSTVVAHEIRNPLMIIKTALRTLRQEGLSPQELREAADDVDHEVARLDRTVGDVLDYARPPRIEPVPTDLDDLCRATCQAPPAGDPGVRLELSFDPTVRTIVTDPERLRTVLVNVLQNARESVRTRCAEQSNAAKAGEPDIRLVTQRIASDRLALLITDRGTGIAPDDLPQLFEPYFTTRRTGTGLGLAIAKNLVEALGGHITASSRLGEGTQIRIELPAQAHTEGR